MPQPRQIHLGVFVLGTGNHIAGWLYPGAAQRFEDLAVVQEIARTAERGKFDLIFLGDNLASDPGMHPSFAARFEPLTMLSALAANDEPCRSRRDREHDLQRPLHRRAAVRIARLER